MHTDQTESNSGVDAVAFTAAVAVLGIIVCLCIICLIVVVLRYTYRKYRKVENPPHERDGDRATREMEHSIHNIPLPPIPTEDATAHNDEAYDTLNPDLTLEEYGASSARNQDSSIPTMMHGNQAYAVNMLGITMEANPAYSSKSPGDQQESNSKSFVCLPPTPQTLSTETTTLQGICNQAHEMDKTDHDESLLEDINYL